MVRCNFKIFIVSLFLVFLVSFVPSLIATVGRVEARNPTNYPEPNRWVSFSDWVK